MYLKKHVIPLPFLFLGFCRYHRMPCGIFLSTAEILYQSNKIDIVEWLELHLSEKYNKCCSEILKFRKICYNVRE